MSLPWWTGIPPAQAAIACGESTHRLIWSDGVLTAADHADPEGERALAALGGEPLPCITLLDTWHRHVEDPDVLLLGSRGPSDPVAMSGDTHDQLARLLALGGGLPRRLDTTVAAHWRERLLSAGPDPDTERVRARLHAALYGRVLGTLAAWLGRSDVSLNLQLAPEGTEPTLRAESDGGITVALPFAWLVDVHGRGLEVVWGRFCLAATTTDGRSWELQTVGPELGTPVALTLSRPD